MFTQCKDIFSYLYERVRTGIVACVSALRWVGQQWNRYAGRFSLVIIILGTSFWYVYTHDIEPPDDFPTGQIVTIPSGGGVTGIGTALKANHVIKSVTAFRVAALLLGHEHVMQAGDYIFKEPSSVWAVARAVSFGAHGLEPITFTIRPGIDSRKMARLYAILPHFDQRLFLQRVDDEHLEGYLFPDTYYFLPNATEDTIIDSMLADFTCRVCAGVACIHGEASTTTAASSSQNVCIVTPEASTTATTIAQSGKPLDDIVNMASILEHEGIGKNDDYRNIAGVLWNRITKNMPLQADAVSLYIPHMPGTPIATLNHIDSPYNTYLHTGLPPTAIGSPSLTSIYAAANPAKSNYLFYMASSGVTYFSTTYQQQQEKVNLYLKGQ